MKMEDEKKAFSMDVVSVKLNPEFKVFSNEPMETPRDVAKVACTLLQDNDRESIIVFNLHSDGKPASCHIAGIGTIDSCMAHPRELLKSTLLSNASSMVIAHNHPSGNLFASEHDIDLTDRMIKVCNLMQIRFLDHIIVAGGKQGQFISMFEKGIIEKSPSGLMQVAESYKPYVAERSLSYGSFGYETRDSQSKVR